MISSIEERAISILEMAVQSKATDIHFIPKQDQINVFFRVSNQLLKKIILSNEHGDRIISFFKFKASMDIGERRRPQNGSFSLTLHDKNIGLRLSTLPSIHSESLVIRILPLDEYLPFERLSLFPKTSRRLLSMLKFSHGLIILTGPTGSGKTTALYSLLQHSSKNLGRNVITLEDPVEKNNDELLQIQVNEKAGITYSSGLKAILRHDPDIIMVGEIRDAETARIAVRAALTGHLVLTTMHTKNARGALYRLKEFGVSWEEMDQTLIAVTAQRLVELMCPACFIEGCTKNCMNQSRAAVYELLYGKALNDELLQLIGKKTYPKYPRLKDVILKGIALGYIKEKEYERWVNIFE